MSLKVTSEKRRTVNMNEEIAYELNRVANLQGKTLYSLINEIASASIEAFRQGFSLREALEAAYLLNRAKKTRLLLVNQDLWYFASDVAYKKSRDEWLRQVYEKAKWYGRVFFDSTSTEAFIESLRQIFPNLIWDCSELELEKKYDETLSLRARFVPEMSLQHTSVLLRAVEGIFNASGYAILKYTVEPGYLASIFKCISLPEEITAKSSV